MNPSVSGFTRFPSIFVTRPSTTVTSRLQVSGQSSGHIRWCTVEVVMGWSPVVRSLARGMCAYCPARADDPAGSLLRQPLQPHEVRDQAEDGEVLDVLRRGGGLAPELLAAKLAQPLVGQAEVVDGPGHALLGLAHVGRGHEALALEV